ncbi:phosphatidylinositol 3-kinase catalytic subunit type 3 [Lepeophtheirus salmonis]|uniref:phosphatidylinositol 3-kinase catalytic subunit type 3 n=1 Tax=Lepeophtheirus salmonis TaxID=72036 RepID=UPI001AE6893D|nr:phosphatidylinositol 3-kinase catalytic subunit type 3-like [Lepeophtheirus salmonis]
MEKDFRFVYSGDLSETALEIKICSMEGTLHGHPYEHLLENPLLKFSGRNSSKTPDLAVEATLGDALGQALHIPVRTAYKAFTRRWEWNQWMRLPLMISDLPRKAFLFLTVYDSQGECGRKVPIGGTHIPLFDSTGVLHQGQMDLRLWNDTQGSLTTPGHSKVESLHPEGENYEEEETRPDLAQLMNLTKQYRAGKIAHVDWLDRLTFAQVEKRKEKEKQNSNLLFLTIEFASAFMESKNIAIVYYDAGLEPHDGSLSERYPNVFSSELLTDENLVENKHHKLTRSQRTGQSEKDLKPNAEVRDRLNAIIAYPSTRSLTSEEKDLMWRYRFYLAKNKKALSKFVKCVNWRLDSEANSALELINNKWAPMDVDDALELLGPQYKHQGLRQYAVSRMKQAPDEDLRLYLLQLVQALKYESISNLPEEEEVFSSFQQQSILMSNDEDTHLASFLIERACKNRAIANYFYWYLIIEVENEKNNYQSQLVKSEPFINQRYQIIFKRFMETLIVGGHSEIKQILDRQFVFINKLVSLLKAVACESGNRQKKIERLQALLMGGQNKDFEEFSQGLQSIEPLELPLDPNIKIKGMIPERATLFKSSQMPAKLSFITDSDEEYIVIFKLGDDLRQDQLIIQIITLMDRILQQENLDLKLTPYPVLPTSTRHGFVQFVNSYAIADILATDGSIQNFLRKYNPSETGPYGISAEAMDTYVKSCAGYCVITYLLGVGDRHLDNLLLTREGKLFHIDFGYILGRDPKPYPPPMKLSKEMIEAFGGDSTEHYSEFRKECFSAFLHLRRYANLILNLFSLMVDASVPDIALEPDKTVQKVQDKFRLDLSDEEAVKYMKNIIDESADAALAAVFERIHKYAQLWRN